MQTKAVERSISLHFIAFHFAFHFAFSQDRHVAPKVSEGPVRVLPGHSAPALLTS